MRRPISVLFVDSRPHSFYGAQQNMWKIAVHLDPAKYRATLVVPADGILPDKFRERGIPVRHLPLAPVAHAFGGEILRYGLLGKLRVAWAIVSYNFAFWRSFRKGGIDLVFANDSRALLYCGMAAKLAGWPVFWFNQGDGRPNLINWLALRLARRVLLIAGACDCVFSERDRRLHAGRMVTFYSGFDFEAFTEVEARAARQAFRRRHGLSAEAPLVGLVASLHERKGHDLLIRAAPEILRHRPDVRFVFVGDASSTGRAYEQRLRALLKEMKLEDSFVWTGFQSDMKDVYLALDLVTLPSRSEGLPGVLIEALGYGRPVVATDVGGVREIVREPEDGRVVTRDDWHALAGAILDLLVPTASEKRAVEERINHVRSRFSIEPCVARFEAEVALMLNSEEREKV